MRRHLKLLVVGVAIHVATSSAVIAQDQSDSRTAPSFTFPVDCTIGEDCFLQNLVDLNKAPGEVQDALCGADSYDSHKGTDVRVRTLTDLRQGVDILAVADGVVLGLRNGEPDRLINTSNVADARNGRECGNGVAIQHANGWRTQYCHMKRGSITVKKGQKVKQGAPLGQMGLSGLTTFPHLHLSVFKDNKIIDPLIGRPQVANACKVISQTTGFFNADETSALIASRDDILAIGLSDSAFKSDALVLDKVPPVPTSSSEAIVAWAWIINAQKDDQVRIRIETEDGVFSDVTSKPLEKRKAQYFHFAGRKRQPKPGTYKVSVFQIRNGGVYQQKVEQFEVL